MNRLHAHDRSSWLPLAVAALAALASLATCARVAGSAPFVVGGGYDYYSGPGGETTRSGLAIGAIELGPGGSLTLAGMRYDDSIVGEGNAFMLGAGFPFVPLTSMRVWGTRFIGDESYRAWRVKGGPMATLPSGATLGLYFQRWQDNVDFRSNAVIAEASVPVIQHFTARGSAAWASLPSDLDAAQGTVGLAWSPLRVLELSAEVGVARNGSIVTSTAPAERGPLSPILGSPPGRTTTSTESRTDGTALLGVRVLFP